MLLAGILEDQLLCQIGALERDVSPAEVDALISDTRGWKGSKYREMRVKRRGKAGFERGPYKQGQWNKRRGGLGKWDG